MRRHTRGGEGRLYKPVTAMVAIAVVLSLAGCGGQDAGGGEFAHEQHAALAFMDALEAGHAQEAAALLSDSVGFAPGSLEDDFYAAAEARPENAEIVSALRFDEETVYVDISFDLAGEQREIKISFDGGDT